MSDRVPLPTYVPGYRTLWTDSLRYLRVSCALKSCWQADQEAKGYVDQTREKADENPTIDRDQSSRRSAHELLLTGSIRRENHQTVTVPGARIFSSRLLREPAGRYCSLIHPGTRLLHCQVVVSFRLRPSPGHTTHTRRGTSSPTITKMPRPESRDDTLRVTSDSTNLRGRR